MIKFHEPYVAKKQEQYVLDALRNSTYSSDKYRQSCLEFLSDMYQTENILITHSATAALEIASKLIKLEKNKKSNILLPSYTFSSTANAFLQDGHNINFIDVNKEDMIVDKSIKLSRNQYCVVVHYANSCFGFSDTNNNMIEDAAQSFDAKLKGKFLGTYGKYGCISFHRTKNIHADYGGMIILNDNSLFDESKYIYERGTDRSEVIAGKKNKYQWVEKGSSYQISELSSALLLSQLEVKDKIKNLRKEIYMTYKEKLSKLSEKGFLTLQKIQPDLEPNYHAFYLISSTENRELIDHLNSNGISAYIGYEPLHLSEYANKNNLNIEKLPVTEKYYKNLVRLPIHTNISIKDANHVVNTVKDFYE